MHAALILVQVLFAGNAVVGKIALRDLSALGMLAIRVPSAALLFLALRAGISRSRGWQRVPWKDALGLCGAGFLGIVLNQFFFFEGLAHTSATNTVVMNTTIPVFAAGFSIALGHERATVRRTAGLALALVGALLVSLLGRGTAGPLQLRLGIGELFLLANSSCYALYLVVSRPLFMRYRTDTAISWIFGFGGVLLLPLGLRAMTHELPNAPLRASLALAFIVIGPTVGAYFLNGFALRRGAATLVAVYIYVQPVIAALLAAWLLDEHITPMTLVGAVLIAAGIALVSLGRPPARP